MDKITNTLTIACVILIALMAITLNGFIWFNWLVVVKVEGSLLGLLIIAVLFIWVVGKLDKKETI